MSDRAWQRLLFATCALAALTLILDLRIMLVENTDLGARFGPTKTPFVERVLSVEPNSNAAVLRPGDLVDARAMTPAQRYVWVHVIPYGTRVTLHVTRDHAQRSVTLVNDRRAIPPWDNWVVFASMAWILLFALLFTWRSPASAQARVLALMLALFVLGIDLEPGNWVSPVAALDLAFGIAGFVFFAASIAMLATYALLFAQPPSALRKSLAACAYGAAALWILAAGVVAVGTWTGNLDPYAALSSPFWPLATAVLPFLTPLLCVLAALAATRGAERQRLTWAALSFGTLYVVMLIGGILWLVTRTPDYGLWHVVVDAATFVAPLGLTYALLSRRLLDITFVVNRAAVFTVVSIVIVGAFVLVEWAVQEWARAAGPAANIAVSAALALALGLSVRFIHVRVEHVLDNVLFRKRHEDQRAIRAFAREAAYITDEATLLERTRAVLEAHADASFVTIALDDGAGHYGIAGENDPAIVALRTWHEVLDLHAAASALRGEFAYPMVARGRLVGALVLGPKRSGEAYAPDESESIAQLALGVGAALDVLSAKKEDSLAALVEAVRALPDAIAARLSDARGLPAD